MTPLMVKLGTAAAALAAGGGFAVLSPASPAAAYYSPPLFLDVSVGAQGSLVSHGAAVQLPVTITCDADSVYLNVQVTEKVGKKVASGATYVSNVACSGGHQTLLVTVPASSGPAFAKGSAYAVAYIDGCKAYTCGSETGSANVKLK